MNQQMLERFNAEHKIDLIAHVRDDAARCSRSAKGCCRRRPTSNRARSGTTAPALLGALGLREPGRPDEVRADAGRRHGPARCPSRSRASISATTTRHWPVQDGAAACPRDAGDGRPDSVFATWDEFDAWRQAHGKLRPGAPRIAVGFYKATYYGGETELLDAVIAEIERQGAEAIPMFGYPGAVAAQRLLSIRAASRAPTRCSASSSISPHPTRRVSSRRSTSRSSIWSASTAAPSRSGARRRPACRCSKAPSRWRCRSWPARSRRPSSAARKRSGIPRPA